MKLKAVSMAERRLQVLEDRKLSGDSVEQVCARWEIAPSTFYRWKARFEGRGLDGLDDISRAPFTSPSQISFDLEDHICRMRKNHPQWGAKRIRAELIRSGTAPPAVSTIHRVLVRNNLVAPQPRKGPKASKRFVREAPNDLWQIDATRVKLASGAFCWVIDILDDHARYLLAAVAAHAESTELACTAFGQAAERYGLPRQVLSDNGLSFSGRLHGGKLVAFERRLKAAGVQLINSRPYHPQTLGKIERFHATMKGWLAEHGPPATLEQLEEMLERFREHYNRERPHQSLGEAVTPAERFVAGEVSPVLPVEEEPAYPAGAVLRMVGANGSLTYDNAKFSVGVVWAHRRLQVIDRQQHIDFFHGERLVRTVAREEGRTYYPLPGRRFPGRRPRR